ncbi:MAG: metal ABC transporter permease, partial [Proteobacteria bacterium]|nr:metal ABC transporter permease [Pseudomonadota bacterium]
MPDLSTIYQIISYILPFECLKAGFMQQAMIGLILLAPMAAVMGVQVVNFRMAFFSDAISHSAFAGVALGLIFSVSPHWTMPLFGLLVGLAIMAVQRKSTLSSDTVIGVFFSAVIAFGLAVVSRDRSVARDMQRFLYGDILTISNNDILFLLILFIALLIFQILSYNRLLYIGINPTLAKAHSIRVATYQYYFAGLLSLIVMFSVWAVGVLLVTAMLIVPAAAARNFARSAGAMFWWALLVSLTSAITGLIISAQDWANTATGATII